MYTQFCRYYREYANVTKATMHIDHKPGESLRLAYWVGQKAAIIDSDKDKLIDPYIFVAVLSCSQYTT